METLDFKKWIESSASTRARNAASLGLLPLAVIGSIHGHSTAPQWQVDSIESFVKKKKKKKSSSKAKR